MKKIVIMLTATVFAVSVQAANYNWKSIKGAVYTDSATILKSGTAYLFDTATLSQQALLIALQGGTAIDTLSSISSASLATTGKITTTSDFSYDGQAGGSIWVAYMAIVNDDRVYISSTVDILAPSNDAAINIAMNSPASTSKQATIEGSTFGSAGWYSTASSSGGGESDNIPEPTSGLLLLVGMGALALRRKQK